METIRTVVERRGDFKTNRIKTDTPDGWEGNRLPVTSKVLAFTMIVMAKWFRPNFNEAFNCGSNVGGQVCEWAGELLSVAEENELERR